MSKLADLVEKEGDEEYGNFLIYELLMQQKKCYTNKLIK